MYDTERSVQQRDILYFELDDLGKDGAKSLPDDGRSGKLRLCLVLSSDKELARKRNVLILPLSGHKPASDNSNIVIFSYGGNSYPIFNAIQMISRTRLRNYSSTLSIEKFDEINNYFHLMHETTTDALDQAIKENMQLRTRLFELEQLTKQCPKATKVAKEESITSIKPTPKFNKDGKLFRGTAKDGYLTPGVIKKTWTKEQCQELVDLVVDRSKYIAKLMSTYMIGSSATAVRCLAACEAKLSEV